MTHWRALLAAVLVTGLLAIACNGDDDEATATATGTAEPTESPTATESPMATETYEATETPEATETATAEPTGVVDPDDPGDVSEVPFDLDDVDNTGITGDAIIAAVRVASHDGFDRFVLEFADEVPEPMTAADGVPAYSVGYVDEATECGSGMPADLEGTAFLQIDLPTSHVVDPESGEPTVDQLEITDDYQAIIEVEEICGFEGQSTWILGVIGPQPYRIFELDDPTRLVIDVSTEGVS